MSETNNIKRRFWQSLEERNATVSLNALPEFPVSRNEMEEQSKKEGVSRKGFLKFMGAGAVLLGASCRRPTEQIVPAVMQAPEYIPGEGSYYATCAPDGTGLIVRTREGRPVKISGNSDHPITEGGVTAYTVASLMDLYDPDRLKGPALISKGKKQSASEDEIVSDATSKLSGGYVLLTSPIESPSSRDIIADFLKKNPGGRHIEFRADPTLRQIAEGQKLSYGDYVIPNYRFDKADLVVSIEGDFLGTMPGSVHFAANFVKKRNLQNGVLKMNRLVVFESMFTTTGSNADDRIPIRPGDATAVALSLAAQLVKTGRAKSAFNNLSNYLPEKVAPVLGIPQAALEKTAEELWAHRGKSIVISGSPLAAFGVNAETQVAVNLLNSMLDNDGVMIDASKPLHYVPGASEKEIFELVEEMRSGKVKTLIVYGANPVYHLPASLKVEEALSKVEYILSLSDRIDETGKLATAILPSSHFLESWGDGMIQEGVYSLRQPVIRPLYQTRSFEDRLIQLSGGQLDGDSSFYDYLKGNWQELKTAAKHGGSFLKFWQSSLQLGYFAPGRNALKADGKARRFNDASLSILPGSPEKEGFKVGLYYNIQVLDGTGGNNAYRQELPDPVTKVVWENVVSIFPQTARDMGLKQGAVVTVKTEQGTLQLPVHLQPGIHPKAMLIALGYGRSAGGAVAVKSGVNALQLAKKGKDSLILSGLAAEMAATGKRHEIPNTQIIYRYNFNTEDKAFFAPAGLPGAPLGGSTDSFMKGTGLAYDRPIVIETSLENYKKNKNFVADQALHYPDESKASIMSSWDYSANMRWHMVIDLNLCTGCGACVTSCNLENNIPMVGPKEVAMGREMHWMRIDRYFSGDEANPEVTHQPMLCQQCENAPCENVCPVAATTHNSEGLNVMTYNRCIGTRYCANNCPYKVRRFNWFENWNYMEGVVRHLKDPQHLGLNPDVTVRARGVMEKCTFCVQRINLARHEMKAKGEKKLRDGVVVTACQDVCPTKAITFGDQNDPKSDVAKLLKKDPRGFKVLDFLGIKPSVTYLARIRNKV